MESGEEVGQMGIGVWVGGNCVIWNPGFKCMESCHLFKICHISVSCPCCFHVLFSSTNGACKNEIKLLVRFMGETDCASFLQEGDTESEPYDDEEFEGYEDKPDTSSKSKDPITIVDVGIQILNPKLTKYLAVINLRNIISDMQLALI